MVNTIRLVLAQRTDMDWVNDTYKEVGFVTSDHSNEVIVIIEVNTVRAGLGRLVSIAPNHLELGGIYVHPNFRGQGLAHKIVAFLCEYSLEKDAEVWCLPFENLSEFYRAFGFEETDVQYAPKVIKKKWRWCNNDAGYKQKVLLMRRIAP